MEEIENIMLHIVPNNKFIATYFDNPIEILDNEKFLLNSVNKALKNDFTLPIKPILDGKELVAREIDKIFTNRTEQQFVDSSIEIAKHLHRIQKGNISDGFLLFLVGKDDKNPCIAIMKLEPSKGMIINRQNEEIKNLEVIKELLLAEESNVYKFIYARYKKGTIEFQIMDDQRFSLDHPIANFWLFDFAYSELIENDKIRTLNAFNFLNKFTSLSEFSPEYQIRFKNAVHAKLTSEKPEFSILDFRDENVPKKYHGIFDDLAKKENISTKKIRKDDTLIINQLRKVVIDFANGAKLSYPYSEHDKTVIPKQMSTQINSSIKRINGIKATQK